MTDKFTARRLEVLNAAADLGASKGNFHRRYWRNFDQLERQGLIQRQAFTGFYRLTDAGRLAHLSHISGADCG